MCFNQLRAFFMLVQCMRSGLTVTVRDSGISAHYDVQKFCIGFSLPGKDSFSDMVGVECYFLKCKKLMPMNFFISC